MLVISDDSIRRQVKSIKKLSDAPKIIYYDEFLKSLTPLYKDVVLPDTINIAPSEDQMLAGDFTPAFSINLKDNIDKLQYKGFPLWRNLSLDQYSLQGIGLIEGNRSNPSNFSLFDTNPHGNVGGATGHGKSVTGNSIIVTGALVHPPWSVQYYLSDPKIVELKPYATYKKPLPHINCVAATADSDYTISVLKYVNSIMSKRALIYESVGVKNIVAFTEKTGLYMPMLVVVLDEVKSMLNMAGKRLSEIDYEITEFITKARFCGGRCLMLSQGVVTELSKEVMTNINIRMALGCTPDASTQLIGNSGASIYLGSMGKMVFNNSPNKSDLKTNVHVVTPFLPDKPNDATSNIYDIFEHLNNVWEELTYKDAKIEPISFFDEQAPLTIEEFLTAIIDKVDKKHIFLGEPVFINKTDYKMDFLSLEPKDEYSSNLGNNILFLSSHSKHKINFLSIMLTNFDELDDPMNVKIYSPLREDNNMIKKLDHRVNRYVQSTSLDDGFYSAVAQAHAKMLMIKVDADIFEDDARGDFIKYSKLFKWVSEATGENLSLIMKNRICLLMGYLAEQTSAVIQGLEVGKVFDGERGEEYNNEFINFGLGAYYLYSDFGHYSSQMTANNSEWDVRVFYNYELLNGTEVKTSRMLDAWMSVVKQAPVYGTIFIIISDMLPASGSSLNGAFNKIVMYQPTMGAVGQQKLGDYFPSNTLECLYIFADKTKTSEVCTKFKFPRMIEAKW